MHFGPFCEVVEVVISSGASNCEFDTEESNSVYDHDEWMIMTISLITLKLMLTVIFVTDAGS